MRTAASTSGPRTARSSRRSSRGRELVDGALAVATDRRRVGGRAEPVGQHVLAAVRARRHQQLEQPAGAEQVEIFGVEVRRIAEPLAALAAALPAIFEAREPALVERRRSQSRDHARSARVRERTSSGDKGERVGSSSQGALAAPDATTSTDAGEEQREPRRRRAVACRRSSAIALGTPRGQSRPVGRVYGRTLPSAFHRYSVRWLFGRVGEGVDLVGLPVAHAEGVRHDARARLELPGQNRPELEVRRRQQVERHDGGLGHVGGQRVLQLEGDQVRDARVLGVRVGFGNPLRVDVDADAARAVDLGGRDRNAAVAAAQVVDDVGLRRPRPAAASGRRLLGASARRAPGGARPAVSAGAWLGDEGHRRATSERRAPGRRRLERDRERMAARIAQAMPAAD